MSALSQVAILEFALGVVFATVMCSTIGAVPALLLGLAVVGVMVMVFVHQDARR